jgi:hypothetical protein
MRIDKCNFRFEFVEGEDVDYIFDEIYEFCKKAEDETTLLKTKQNMKGEGWKLYPESLMYRLYIKRTYSSGDGALSILYDDDGICAISGVEKHTDDIAIMSKRLYVLRKYRFMPIMSRFLIKPQIEWATKRGFKACLITVNEYQRHTVLQLFKRMQSRKAIVFGEQIYKDGNIYDQMSILPVKVYINGEHQYIIVHKIDKGYNLNLKEL